MSSSEKKWSSPLKKHTWNKTLGGGSAMKKTIPSHESKLNTNDS